jgi:hypothetical protein
MLGGALGPARRRAIEHQLKLGRYFRARAISCRSRKRTSWPTPSRWARPASNGSEPVGVCAAITPWNFPAAIVPAGMRVEYSKIAVADLGIEKSLRLQRHEGKRHPRLIRPTLCV